MSGLFDSLKFGSDPELFVRRKKDGKMVSVHNMLPGDKKNPHKVPKGAIQVDGLAAEFNIDPVNNLEEWMDNHLTVMKELNHYMGSSYELVCEPVAFFSKEHFDALPPETQMLGCDPDYNAWTGEKNPPPNASQLTKEDGSVMRTASGHIHIGWTSGQDIYDSDFRKRCFELVKMMDRGVTYNTLFNPDSNLRELDRLRRTMYGKAGACRIKPYGVEVRSPSNIWLTSELQMKAAFWRAKKTAINFFLGKTMTKDDIKDVMAKLG